MGNRIVFCACCEVGVNILKCLIKNKIEISYIVSLLPEMAEKEKISGYYDYRQLANEFVIPVYNPEKYSLKSEKDLAFFKNNKFDLLLTGGWQRLFPEKVLKTLDIGGIGLHGSSEFLPKGRGRSPVNWSLIEGKKRFILHLFLMKPEADNGEVLDFQTFDINEFDDCNTLYYKIAIVTQKMLLKNIPLLLRNNYTLIPQLGDPSFYPKRTAEDGKIDWSKQVFEIYNFIRALTKPYPGAFCYYNNQKSYIWKSQVFDTRITYYEAKIGEIVEVFESGDFVINCNSGLLLVTNADFNPVTGEILA